MSRDIIIGDVHGCITELNILLEELCPTDKDTIIFAGDIIHKGPGPNKVVDRAIELGAVLVLGNHEEKQLRWIRAEARRLDTGQPNKMQNIKDLVATTLTAKQLEYIKTSKLFYQGFNYIVVHGGILPSMRKLPKNNQYSDFTGKEKKFWSQMLRTRYINPEGRMVHFGNETSDDVYWATDYDGRFGHALFGHQPFMQKKPAYFKHATGLDLGCVYGNYLCAAIVEGEQITYKTVKASVKYAEHIYKTKG